jgi:hypothetical protein
VYVWLLENVYPDGPMMSGVALKGVRSRLGRVFNVSFAPKPTELIADARTDSRYGEWKLILQIGESLPIARHDELTTRGRQELLWPKVHYAACRWR